MRMLTTLAASAALSLALPVYAHAEPPATGQESNQRLAERIRNVTIIDVANLSPKLQSQVATELAQTSDQELETLRRTIDGVPQASSALKAKGLDTSKVIAAALDDGGTLTLVTKTAGA